MSSDVQYKDVVVVVVVVVQNLTNKRTNYRTWTTQGDP